MSEEIKIIEEQTIAEKTQNVTDNKMSLKEEAESFKFFKNFKLNIKTTAPTNDNSAFGIFRKTHLPICETHVPKQTSRPVYHPIVAAVGVHLYNVFAYGVV